MGKVFNDKARKAAAAILKTQRWKKLSKAKLDADPICEHGDCTQGAEEVHHIQSRLLRPDLAYTWSNLMSVCLKHHIQLERE